MKILSWTGAVAVAVAAGAFVFGGGAQAAESPSASSLVEDYSYPGAAQILAKDELKLIGGDGHIMFTKRINPLTEVQCQTTEIQVEQFVAGGSGWYYCFKTIGTTGVLTLEVPATYGVRSGANPLYVSADLSQGADPDPILVPANTPVGIYPGSGNEEPEAVLVEIRLA
ncbi:hypothetical protein [Actinoplanes sp. NPDC051859]|uniref:hypothetical protein n=1 Tax=Actinoplanes sp. NPDC051859 TaxID=3363909 RepID=UPI00379AE681